MICCFSPGQAWRGLRRPLWFCIFALLSVGVGTTRGDVVINEILYRPGTATPENTKLEFIELQNTGAETVLLENWQFTKGVSFTFPAGVAIGPESYLVVAADVATFRAANPSVVNVVGGWLGQLSNSGERVELVDAAGGIVDSVEYSDEGDWAQRVYGASTGWVWNTSAATGGNSLELRNPALPHDRGQNWASSNVVGGTPGAINSAAAANIAPLITEVRHSPAVPKPSESVTIACTLEDENFPNAMATLFWRVATSSSPGGFESTQMTLAPNGRFSATISPQETGAVIEFYVNASDGTNIRTWPAPTATGQQNANAFFQVSSSLDSGATSHYRLILSGQELAIYNTILQTNRGSDAQVNMTMVASDPGEDGGYTIRYLCGMRLRGNSSRSYNPPPLRVSLPADNPWGDVGSMNLNTKYPWLQVIGMRILATNGIAAPDAKGVRVSINGVDRSTHVNMAGRHAHLEPLNSQFVRRHFPSDSGGNLYAKRSSDSISGFARDRIRWGVVNETNIRYNTSGWWTREKWDKDTNSAVNDWSDLTAFVRAMNTPTGATYKEQIGAQINIEQWLRWLAILTLLNDYETNPSNGIDDDYSIYRGETDRRFVLIPHDLDTILGQGDTIGPATGSLFPFVTDESGIQGDDRIPQLNAFINHPEIRARYFTILKELLNGSFSKTQFDAFLRNHLGGWVAQGTINSMISWMDQRRTFALNSVDLSLSARSALAVQNGFPRTNLAVTTVSGNFDLSDTAAVRVNGVNAVLNFGTGAWNVGNVALMPGLNRVVIQSIDADGKVLETQTLDIWRDTGTTQPLPAVITTNTSLTAANGPYFITGNVVVNPGATLTVEAGTNLWFDANAKLTVNGVLRLLGSEFAHIRCCPPPTAVAVADPLAAGLPVGPPKWAGIRLVDSMSDQNVIQWADFLHAQDAKDVNEGSIGVIRSRMVLDHLTIAGTRLRMLFSSSSSVLLQDSVFPSMFSGEEDPISLGLEGTSDHIRGIGEIPEDGFYIIRRNTFGSNKAGNDIIHISSGESPDPIAQILDNTFAGMGAGGVQIDGGTYIAGNFFNGAASVSGPPNVNFSRAISISDSARRTTSAVVRNVFYDMDQALNLENGAAAFFENNTVVKIRGGTGAGSGVSRIGAAINLFDPEQAGDRGDGCYVRDNIFFDTPLLFANADYPPGVTSKLELFDNMLTGALAETLISAARPESITTLGTGNFVADAQFTNSGVNDFTLVSGTAGTGVGTFGQDLGAAVRSGIFVTGEPDSDTAGNYATLRVGGPGIFAFRYRVNGGAWSVDQRIGTEEFSRRDPSMRDGIIELFGLAPGTYMVEVLGRDFAGNWQTTPTASKTWTVGPSLGRVLINEVLADNRTVYEVDGGFPDFIELHNPGPTAIDLSGKSLSDDPAVPTKFIFPAGTILHAGSYLVLYGDNTAGNYPYLGFALDTRGEGVYLYDSEANGSGLLDSVAFGLQLPDLSIGRAGSSRTWTLTQPTPASANISQPLGNPSGVKINEWLAASEVRFGDDFVELYNPSTLPVALGGMRLSDDPYSEPAKFVVHPLSFAPARGFTVFIGGNGAETDASILSFQLSAGFEMLALADANGKNLHLVDFDSERTDISQGLAPDGGVLWADMLVPTPGASNLTSGAEYNRILALLNGLRISELMYHPSGNSDLEYIELVNISGSILDLTGVRFVEGIDFVFPAMTLTPGSRILVVKNSVLMRAAYGPNLNIAGEYGGRLDNSGEKITLSLPAPYEAAILSFRYSNTWAVPTAGGGRSLEFANTGLSPSAWSDAGSWRASVENGGNPITLVKPRITSVPSASTILGDAFIYQIQADENPASFNAVGLPPGLAVDTLSGIISGNTTAYGTYVIAISASNSVGADTQSLTLSVAPSGALTEFVWDPIPSTQQFSVPFSTTIRAIDAKGRTVRDFVGQANISGPAENPVVTVGTSTSTWSIPLASASDDARTQIIYRADEIGNSGNISALSLYVSTIPIQPLANFTIRMKHTALTSYGMGAEWESSDWTTVYKTAATINATGWVRFNFLTPFTYDGVRNLLVDISFNNSSSSTNSLCRYTDVGVSRTIYHQTNSNSGDPLNWSGQVDPIPTLSTRVPNVRLTFDYSEVVVTPETTGNFTDGTWTGSLAAASAGTSVRLRADDGAGHTGNSNGFSLSPAPAPVIDSPLSVFAVEGQEFSYKITASGLPSAYGTTGLPDGLSIDEAHGIISGSFAADGSHAISVSATNSSGTGTAMLSVGVESDTDRDGLPDSWEYLNGLNPNQANDASLDSDGDGVSNLSEFRAGTRPYDQTSRFAVLDVKRTGPAGRNATLTWSAIAGRRYRVLSKSNLSTGEWTEVTRVPITANGPTVTFTHTAGLSTDLRFYRVEILP